MTDAVLLAIGAVIVGGIVFYAMLVYTLVAANPIEDPTRHEVLDEHD